MTQVRSQKTTCGMVSGVELRQSGLLSGVELRQSGWPSKCVSRLSHLSCQMVNFGCLFDSQTPRRTAAHV